MSRHISRIHLNYFRNFIERSLLKSGKFSLNVIKFVYIKPLMHKLNFEMVNTEAIY